MLELYEFLDFAITEKKSLLLETKHPVPSRTEIENQIVKKLHAESKRIEKAGIDITVMSFSWFAVERVKALDSKILLLYKGGTNRLKRSVSLFFIMCLSIFLELNMA